MTACFGEYKMVNTPTITSAETASMNPSYSMPFNPLDYPGLFTRPRRLAEPLSWVEHIPFIMVLVDILKPHLLVELGTHAGNSYCAMCQAVQQNHLDTRCYAIDTWQAHGYGLGILALDQNQPEPLRQILHCSREQAAVVSVFFAEIGSKLKAQAQVQAANASGGMAQVFVPTAAGYNEAASYQLQVLPGQ